MTGWLIGLLSVATAVGGLVAVYVFVLRPWHLHWGATADEVFGRYSGLDNYRRQLEREGAPSPGGLAVTGTEAEIETQLRRLAGLGVTELWPVIFPVGGDPAASRRETRALLTVLAAGS